MFPRLYGYERVGILFKDDIQNCFYMINSDDYENQKILEENVVRFPMTIGLTGIAA